MSGLYSSTPPNEQEQVHSTNITSPSRERPEKRKNKKRHHHHAHGSSNRHHHSAAHSKDRNTKSSTGTDSEATRRVDMRRKVEDDRRLELCPIDDQGQFVSSAASKRVKTSRYTCNSAHKQADQRRLPEQISFSSMHDKDRHPYATNDCAATSGCDDGLVQQSTPDAAECRNGESNEYDIEATAIWSEHVSEETAPRTHPREQDLVEARVIWVEDPRPEELVPGPLVDVCIEPIRRQERNEEQQVILEPIASISTTNVGGGAGSPFCSIKTLLILLLVVIGGAVVGVVTRVTMGLDPRSIFVYIALVPVLIAVALFSVLFCS